MERVVTRQDSFVGAEEAERAFYRSLTPEERLDILLELIGRMQEDAHEVEQGLARVYRIVELERR